MNHWRQRTVSSAILQIAICNLQIAIPVLLLPFSTVASAAETQEIITPQEKWSAVFGGDKMDFHFTIEPANPLTGRVEWNLSAGASRATIATGESAVTAAPGKPAQVAITLNLPEIKAGAVVKAQLRVSVYDDNAALAANREQLLWIFPRDPFSLRKQWLKDLKISLYDPEKTTRDVFTKLEIPFDEINEDALAGLKGGLLIIGQGVSFKESPTLPETLMKIAAGGVSVLCLAPVGGTFPIPGTDRSSLPGPGGVSFRRQDLITELDKRLDATAWPPDGQVIASSLVLKADDNMVVGELVKGPAGWPLVEVDFPDQKSKVVICGFGLLGKAWEAGPTPRFLLRALLEQVRE